MKNIKIIVTIMAMSTTPIAFAAGTGDHKHHDMHGEGGHGAGAHWMAPAAEQQRLNPVKATDASINKGARLFEQNCVSCHGVNAEGDGPAGMALNPKPTNLRAMSGGHPDGDFAWKIKHGRGAMPAWGSMLNDEKIWHLVNFIQSLGNEKGLKKVDNHDHSGHKH